MAIPERFSDRMDLHKPADGLVRDEIHAGVRNTLRNLMSGLIEDHRKSAILRSVVVQLDRDPRDYANPDLEGIWRNARALDEYLKILPWNEFLDVCQVIAAELSDEETEIFRAMLNSRLRRYYSAYEMGEDGIIREPGTGPAEAVIAEARALLMDPALEGPDRQFQAALDAFDERPEPKFESAVTNAVNAIEGTARICLNDPNIKLGAALAAIKSEHDLHGALTHTIGSLWGFASQGPRHGLVGKATLDRVVTEYVLHQSAAAIVMIARLYGHGIAEGPARR